MRDIHTYNGYHLGDSIFLIHYLRKICEVNDVRAFCYMKKRYFKECLKHLNGFEERIILKPLSSRPQESVNGWSGSLPTSKRTGLCKGRVWRLNEVYYQLYKHMSELLEVQDPFSGKGCTVMDNPKILEPVHDDFKDCDFLFGNCPALSGQYTYNPLSFINKFNELKDQCDYKFASVHPLKGTDIPSTLDHGLDLIQIGAVAKQAKCVVAIASSPIIYCFNKWNIDTVKKWVVLSRRSTYTYNDRIIRKANITKLMIEDIT